MLNKTQLAEIRARAQEDHLELNKKAMMEAAADRRALFYHIVGLMGEAKAKDETIEMINGRLLKEVCRTAQLERERDAAVNWIQEFTESIDQPCVACKNYTPGPICRPTCDGCGVMGSQSCKWQWRGPVADGEG